MAVVYVDLINGNDDTGDGTPENPFKTIAKAETGLGPGDEIRLAKTDPVQLPGTITWNQNSTSMDTSEDLTSVLSPGDYIGKNDGLWYYVNSVFSDHIILADQYHGPQETTVAYKAVGREYAPSSSTETCEQLTINGTPQNPVKVTGGWDLATETREGVTVLISTTETGRALHLNPGAWIRLSYLTFLGFYYGIYSVRSRVFLDSCYFAWSNYAIDGFYAGEVSNCKSSSDYYFVRSYGTSRGPCILKNCVVHEASYVFIAPKTSNSILDSCEIKGCRTVVSLGPVQATSCWLVIKDCILADISNLISDGGGSIFLFGCSCEGNIHLTYVGRIVLVNCTLGENMEFAPGSYGSGPFRYVIINTTEGIYKEHYFMRGDYHDSSGHLVIERETTEARTGYCAKITGYSWAADEWEWALPVLRGVPIPGGTKQRIKIWLKVSSDFEGTIQLVLRRNPLENWVTKDITPSTEWQQFYIDMPEMLGSHDATLKAGILITKSDIQPGTIYMDEITTEEIA